ncbi:MAG: hypothetical protein ACETWG_04950 [Candidatus Neomarinimicrobiota bacterium]
MSQPSFDEFEQIFSRAQVELPPHLKERLLAIPRMSTSVSFWDLSWVLPAALMVPAALWLIITHAGALWNSIIANAAPLVEGLALPSLPTPSLPQAGALWELIVTKAASLTESLGLPALLTPTLFSLAVVLGVVVVVMSIWLYLRAESQATLLFARRLTRAL